MAADLTTKADLPSAWLIRFSPYLKAGTRVLEIASGNGRNTRFLAGLGCKVTAVDINPAPEPVEGVQYIRKDLEKEDWIFEPESFDAVIGINYLWRAIPVKEMMLYTGKTPSGREFMELMEQLNRILNARLGSEIDFIVKGYDNETRSVVGSRREAMLRKRQTFYLDTDEMGEHLIYEGRVVQARVVAVAEKVIRVEVFGVETSIVARGLSWEWIGNARDHFSVGDRILVRVLKINRTDVEHLTIRVDARSVSATNSHDNLKKCMPQCRYAGRVTDVRNGVVFIRLNNGVNAIAHSCYDPRYPGKKDDVSFAVTRIDEEQGVAIGIITRIIKQNL